MKFNAITIILIIICKTKPQNAAKYLIPRNCTEPYSTQVIKYVPYEEPYRVRNWYGAYKWKVRTNYRRENQTKYEKRSICCDGYATYGLNSCTPICHQNCGLNGVCTKPETCECSNGYKMDLYSNQCQPVCSETCENGQCVLPNVCTCKEGFRMLPNGYTCVPICNSCTNLEYCVEPHICKCINGYTRSSIERLDRATITECKAICDRECVNADCVEPNLCKCHPGYFNYDEDVFTCQPKCTFGCKDGYCTAPETCTCYTGYELKSNNTNICEPVCKKKCINGDCIAPDLCSCHDGFLSSKNKSDNVCEPYCRSNCLNGQCIAPEVCTCDSGYKAVENESSCDPICSESCIMGNCTAPETCTCLDGYELENTYNCKPICKNECPNGQCIAPDLCTCNPGYKEALNKSLCEPICYDSCIMGHCTAPETCTCFEGYKSTHENSSICEPVCKDECINGLCTAPDECTCNDGYEKKNSTINSNKCIVICECEKGYCNDNSSSCETCFDGYHLNLIDNSTLCNPYCKSGCENGLCIEPELCECHKNYISHNDTNGNSICIHACGGDCAYGTCIVENGTCSCNYGWSGKHCDEAILCAVTISDNQTTFLQLNESENLSSLDEGWLGPLCNNRCIEELTNSSTCLKNTETEQLNIICFIDTASQCNVNNIQKSSLYRENISILVVSSVTSVVVVTLAFIVIIFRLRKRRTSRSIELMKTIQMRRQEEDCLIETENSVISL